MPTRLARSGDRTGSYPITVIPKACMRSATVRPILPTPTIPSVFSKTSNPMKDFRSHAPPRSEAFACGIRRAMASIMAIVCSAVETVLPDGALMTNTPS